jgi:hypothetical protein
MKDFVMPTCGFVVRRRVLPIRASARTPLTTAMAEFLSRQAAQPPEVSPEFRGSSRQIPQPMLLLMDLPRTGRTPPPKSNTERQRLFRKRNPGYYQRLHAKRRAKIAAMVAAMNAVPPETQQALAAPRQPLLLPAPVVIMELPVQQATPVVVTFAPPVADGRVDR